MGLLELELILVPGTEVSIQRWKLRCFLYIQKLKFKATDNPVGVGREEPNRDPFLPEVMENRSYIATSALATGFFAATNKVRFTDRNKYIK